MRRRPRGRRNPATFGNIKKKKIEKKKQKEIEREAERCLVCQKEKGEEETGTMGVELVESCERHGIRRDPPRNSFPYSRNRKVVSPLR